VNLIPTAGQHLMHHHQENNCKEATPAIDGHDDAAPDPIVPSTGIRAQTSISLNSFSSLGFRRRFWGKSELKILIGR
jgi:hypothetical protein